MTKRYDLIVFDWDGTVMDSTAIIAASIQAACRDLKLTVPDDETARHVIGLGLMQALRYAVPDAPEEMYEPLVARYRHHFLSQNDTIPCSIRHGRRLSNCAMPVTGLQWRRAKIATAWITHWNRPKWASIFMPHARQTAHSPSRILRCCWNSWTNWM
jgi:hypothetical protein